MEVGGRSRSYALKLKGAGQRIGLAFVLTDR